MRQAAEPGAYVSKSLNGDAGLGQVQAHVPRRFLQYKKRSPSGGRLPAGRSPDFQRFAGNNGQCISVSLAVFVHYPGHGLGVGAKVGSGDVAVGTQNVLNVLGITAGNGVEFPFAERQRVQLNASFGPAEGQIQQGGLPGHQGCQSPHLVLVGQGMEPQAAFIGAAGSVVLHPVSGEHLNVSVVHPHREGYS